MSKKWISMLLAVLMLFGLSVPVLAEGEPETPPPAETVEEAPSVGEAPPAPVEVAPVEDAVTEDTAVVEDAAITEDVAMEKNTVEAENADDGIMTVSAAPVSVGEVTVNLTGALEGIKYDVTYTSPGGEGKYFLCKSGIYYVDYDLNKYWVENTSNWSTQFNMHPGGEIKINLLPGYDVAIDNATVKEDFVDSWYGGDDAFFATRYVTVTAPNSGTVTINITSEGDTANTPKLVCFTFYNNTPDIVVGGEDWGSSSPDMKTLEDGSVQWKVNTGGEFSEWVAPGYAIEVLKGGYVVRTEAPSGPAASGVPAGSTSYVLHVDLDADEFVMAAVKQGETFTVPDDFAPQIEAPPAEDTTAQTGGTFTDVASGVWYADTIQKAYSSGIVKGVTDTTFAPNGTTTRGQTVTMLYRAMGSPGGSNVFSDTTGEVGSAAGWASANGVTNGVSATAFSPNSSITREQLVTMLYRMAGSPPADTSKLASYSDGGSVQSYAQSAVAWAISNGLLTGYGDGTIRPAATASRAEVCTFIMRYLGV